MSNKSPFHRHQHAPSFNAPPIKQPEVVIEDVSNEEPTQEIESDPHPIDCNSPIPETVKATPEKVIAQYCGKAKDDGEFYKRNDHIWSYQGVYYGHKHLPKGVLAGQLAKKRSVML